MNIHEVRHFIFDDRMTYDWKIIRLLPGGTSELCVNGIDDLAKHDCFLIEDIHGECPIPNIDYNDTCFIATNESYLSLSLPEGTFQINAITEYRRMDMGGSL